MKSFDLIPHLQRQREFSLRAFGPGARTGMVLDHIRKELVEVEATPLSVDEWSDLILLSLDGAWRAGHEPEAIAQAIHDKLCVNEKRDWPDWRAVDPDKAIEHVRSESTESETYELKNYDPNIYWGEHVIELTYMQWDFKATATVRIGGNTKGASILKSAIDVHAEELWKTQGDVPTLVLCKPGPDEDECLECTCDEYVHESDTNPDIEQWLERMCVGLRIVGHTQEERKR